MTALDTQEPPNFLVIMVDQFTVGAAPFHGNEIVQAPHLTRLAAEGVTFDAAYCNFPLCAPSRASFMSGQMPSELGVFDNGADFTASTPTIAHFLRQRGYRTSLAGKMHFIGPDQLHGFEERLTPELYPADFSWTADWRPDAERTNWQFDRESVRAAGTAEASLQRDYDDEVAFMAVRALTDRARDVRDDRRPWLLVASFTHPHDPFTIPRRFWDLYESGDIPLPEVPPLDLDEHDPITRHMAEVYGGEPGRVTSDELVRARRAYYAAVSYVDEKVGQLLETLEAYDLADNTVVVFAADHGEMLGERGLWFKNVWFEPAARVPLVVWSPSRWRPARVGDPVSLVDVLPTLLEISGSREEPGDYALAGRSLVPLLNGEHDPERVVYGEYTSDGVAAPSLMIRRGPFKYVTCDGVEDQLYDLDTDPNERCNLALEPTHADERRALAERASSQWDSAAIAARVVLSQRRRRLVDEAHRVGRAPDWDLETQSGAGGRYVRDGADYKGLVARRQYPPPA